MMIKTVAVLICLGLSSRCLAVDEREEPALQYFLEVNGKQHELFLNKQMKIRGAYSDPQVVLNVSSTRKFAYGGVAFEYPAYFSWEAEIENDEEKVWTLSGNDFKVMYFVMPDSLTIENYAEAMVERFGEGSTRVSGSERKLGARRFTGKLLFVQLAGTVLNLEIYALPAQSGSRLLVLQDSPRDDGAISEEGEKALQLLSTSFSETTALH